MPKDLRDRAAGPSHDQARAPAQSGTQYRMLQVCDRFLARGKCVPPSHLALTQALYLREDEPHPMSPLAAIAQLAEHVAKNGVLGIDKAQQRVGRVACAHGASFTAA